MGTFPRSGKRIDWILISRHFRFKRYEVLPQHEREEVVLQLLLDAVQDSSVFRRYRTVMFEQTTLIRRQWIRIEAQVVTVFHRRWRA